MQPLACIPVDWDQLAAAGAAAAVAVASTLAAKHRPADARTRADDGHQDEADLPWLDDLEVWKDSEAAEPLAGWPPARSGGRLRRAVDELRGGAANRSA